jgi:hypothetical protein
MLDDERLKAGQTDRRPTHGMALRLDGEPAIPMPPTDEGTSERKMRGI